MFKLGDAGEKVQWNGMSEKERLMHSVGVKEIFKEELERELKSGAAKIWVDGFAMLVGKLKAENSDIPDATKSPRAAALSFIKLGRYHPTARCACQPFRNAYGIRFLRDLGAGSSSRSSQGVQGASNPPAPGLLSERI